MYIFCKDIQGLLPFIDVLVWWVSGSTFSRPSPKDILPSPVRITKCIMASSAFTRIRALCSVDSLGSVAKMLGIFPLPERATAMVFPHVSNMQAGTGYGGFEKGGLVGPALVGASLACTVGVIYFCVLFSKCP